MSRRKTFAVSLAIFVVLILLLPAPGASAAPAAPPAVCAAWQDDFTGRKLDTARWEVGDRQAPGQRDNHIGFYQPDRVSVAGGYLVMRLTQEYDALQGVVSRGALVSSRMKCGYGTYEWTMRMSSDAPSPRAWGRPWSGSVSAGFIYFNNSQTEIDFEFSAAAPETLYLVNWLNPTPPTGPDESKDETVTEVKPFNSPLTFHTYTFVWKPRSISYFIDGRLRAVHTTNVPSAPANFMMNHWGSDFIYWGGPATVGVERFFYVDSVSFRPLGKADDHDDRFDGRDGDHRNHRNGHDRGDRDGHGGDDRDGHGGDDRDGHNRDDRDDHSDRNSDRDR